MSNGSTRLAALYLQVKELSTPTTKLLKSPKQTHRKLGANASKAPSKPIESPEQTHRKPVANYPFARSKLDRRFI